MFKHILILVLPLLIESTDEGALRVAQTKGADFRRIFGRRSHELYTYCSADHIMQCHKHVLRQGEQHVSYTLPDGSAVDAKAVAIVWRDTFCQARYVPNHTPEAYVFLNDCTRMKDVNVSEGKVEAELSTGGWEYCESNQCRKSDRSQLTHTVWTLNTD